MEDSELEHLFDKATDFVKASTDKLDSSQLLYLYARYKQINEGECEIQRPGFFDFKGKQKWDAWNELKDMKKEVAMMQYINMLDEFDSEWLEKMDSGAIIIRTGMGIGISTPSRTSKPIADDQKDIFDWCKENDVNKVAEILKNDSECIDRPDHMGLCLLHWACDSGFSEMVRLILGHSSNIDITDNEGQTALHYAVSCGHLDVVKLLLEHSPNINKLDNEGHSALDLYENDYDIDIKSLLIEHQATKS